MCSAFFSYMNKACKTHIRACYFSQSIFFRVVDLTAFSFLRPFVAILSLFSLELIPFVGNANILYTYCYHSRLVEDVGQEAFQFCAVCVAPMIFTGRVSHINFCLKHFSLTQTTAVFQSSYVNNCNAVGNDFEIT